MNTTMRRLHAKLIASHPDAKAAVAETDAKRGNEERVEPEVEEDDEDVEDVEDEEGGEEEEDDEDGDGGDWEDEESEEEEEEGDGLGEEGLGAMQELFALLREASRLSQEEVTVRAADTDATVEDGPEAWRKVADQSYQRFLRALEAHPHLRPLVTSLFY